MDFSNISEELKNTVNLSSVLGFELIPTPDPDVCYASMKVDEHTRQPFGYLSGGASLALAETLAGAASVSLCPDMICVGVTVNGTHIKAVPEGDTVTACARLVKKARHLHIWQVELTDSSGDLVCSVTVTNYIRPIKY